MASEPKKVVFEFFPNEVAWIAASLELQVASLKRALNSKSMPDVKAAYAKNLESLLQLKAKVDSQVSF